MTLSDELRVAAERRHVEPGALAALLRRAADALDAKAQDAAPAVPDLTRGPFDISHDTPDCTIYECVTGNHLIVGRVYGDSKLLRSQASALARLFAASTRLLAYVECEEAFTQWRIDGDYARREAVFREHGWDDATGMVPWLATLRRSALAAVRGEETP